MKYSRTSQGCTGAGFYGNCRAVFSAVVSATPALCFEAGKEGRVRTAPKGGRAESGATCPITVKTKSLSLRTDHVMHLLTSSFSEGDDAERRHVTIKQSLHSKMWQTSLSCGHKLELLNFSSLSSVFKWIATNTLWCLEVYFKVKLYTKDKKNTMIFFSENFAHLNSFFMILFLIHFLHKYYNESRNSKELPNPSPTQIKTPFNLFISTTVIEIFWESRKIENQIKTSSTCMQQNGLNLTHDTSPLWEQKFS